MASANTTFAGVEFTPQNEPLERAITVCDLVNMPAKWNGVRVRVTAVATYEFENFSLSDEACPEAAVWLTYGGRVSSGAVYCCPGEGGADTRPEPLVVDGTPVDIVDDSVFRQLRLLFRKQERTVVRATVLGTFFAGVQDRTAGTWGGFGHFGCCSLFVIQRVERFEEIG